MGQFLRRAAARRIALPPVDGIPAGRIVDLPGRGRTYVIDIPGPTDTAPTVVLLHALSCTAALSWCAAFDELSKHYRVVTFDLRWHGRGIRSRRFRFADCADDVAAVLDALDIDRAVIVGYSMGGAIAQLAWQRHPDRVAGLVLCSTARNFRGKTRERAFFTMLTGVMFPLSRLALRRVEELAATLAGHARRPMSKPRCGGAPSSAAPAPGRCPRCSASSAGSIPRRGSVRSTCPPRSW